MEHHTAKGHSTYCHNVDLTAVSTAFIAPGLPLVRRPKSKSSHSLSVIMNAAPRRQVIQGILAYSALLLAPQISTPPARSSPTDEKSYDVFKSRRYIDIGPPSPDSEPPRFLSDKPIFSIDEGLEGQDINIGEGPPAESGSLVVARWIIHLSNGMTVDNSNMNSQALFRPFAHQVIPGIEDSIIGMRKGGHRRVAGSAERILS